MLSVDQETQQRRPQQQTDTEMNQLRHGLIKMKQRWSVLEVPLQRSNEVTLKLIHLRPQSTHLLEVLHEQTDQVRSLHGKVNAGGGDVTSWSHQERSELILKQCHNSDAVFKSIMLACS